MLSKPITGHISLWKINIPKQFKLELWTDIFSVFYQFKGNNSRNTEKVQKKTGYGDDHVQQISFKKCNPFLRTSSLRTGGPTEGRPGHNSIRPSGVYKRWQRVSSSSNLSQRVNLTIIETIQSDNAVTRMDLEWI